MSVPSVKLIYASTPRGVIGNQGSLPWSLPEDLTLFKQKTLHGTVMMGRKTFDSLHESVKPLPNRKNVVVSRNRDLKIPGVKIIHNPIEFIFRCKEPIWVMGGGDLYAQVHHLCDEVHHTEVLTEVEGDATFDFNPEGWDLANDSGQLRSRSGLQYRVRHWGIPLLLNRY